MMADINQEKEICIVCDFVDEPRIEVGYAEWLKPELSNEQIEEVIRKQSEVVVYWPSCDITQPRAMKQQLDDNNCTWKRHVTRIIAHGGWANMCKQSKNYESTTSRRNKSMKNKCLSSDNFDMEEQSKDLSEASHRKKRKTENPVLKETANCTNKKGENYVRLINDVSSPSEDDEDLHQYSKKDLMTTVEMLRRENRSLREENARLKGLKSVNDDLPEMKKLSTEILRNLRATSVLVGLYSSAETRCFRNDNSPEKNDVSSTLLTTSVGSKRPSFAEHQSDVVENTTSGVSSRCRQFEATQLKQEPMFEEASSFDDRLSMKDCHSDRDMSPALSLEDGPKPVPDQEFSYHEAFVLGEPDLIGESPKLEEELVDLGAGCLVDADQLSKCSRKNATKLTCDVLSLVFTREELASSSLTGKVPNTHKKKAGIRAKKKLDPAKVAAISAFVVQEFGATATKGEILTAIKNKCNNTAKALRREKERSFNVAVECSETV